MNIEKIVLTVKEERTHTIVISKETGFFNMPECGNELVRVVNEAVDSPEAYMCRESTSTEVETISVETDIIECNQQG